MQRGPAAGNPDQGPEGRRANAPPWIDVHAHLVGGADYAASAALAVRAMDEAGVLSSILMPTPQPPGDTTPYDQDSFIDVLKRWPGRLFSMGGGGSLGPMILADPDAETVSEATRQKFTAMAEAIIDAGAVGFGEMTANHLSHNDMHSYHRSRVDHPLFLLLADIAARRNVVIDMHLDPVIEPVAPLSRLHSQRNPPTLTPNLAQFEILLAHNRNARIIWSHAGWDQTGVFTAGLARRMLRDHPNLYMSLKPTRSEAPNQVLGPDGRVVPQWRQLIAEFPDRFVVGTDRFYLAGQVSMSGASGGRQTGRATAGTVFAERGATLTSAAGAMLSQFPPELAQRIAVDNVRAIYRLP